MEIYNGMERCLHITAFAVLLFTLVSCSREQEMTAPHGAYPLAFTVSSGQSRAGDAADGLTDEECRIRSLWVYAFDDSYPAADYHAEPDINNGTGVVDKYTVRMDIYDEGDKRIYVIANPPVYIREQLTPSCSEEFLKALTLQMQRPIDAMSKLPQNIDGVSDAGDKGFPMANVIVARAKLQAGASRRMCLLTPATEDEITSIPLIRALGKVVVKAYHLLGAGETADAVTPVAVTSLKIYNYTADGLFVPAWKGDNTLDLELHAQRETKVQTVAASVFGSDKAADESHPGYIDANYASKDNARKITAFYLCQNSYGKDDTGGLEDAVGNRTTRLVISLSDGRTTEIQLPYLRRNDRLTVRLGISRYAIRFDFELWWLADVNPDWSEEVTNK